MYNINPPKRNLGFLWLIMFVSGFSNAAELTVVDDDFADGDFSKSPAWSPVSSINWFNPFFVAGFDDKQWIGSKRYGSMGTPFKDPDRKGWKTTLDARQEPITISFLVRFEAISDKNAISVYILGQDCRFVFRFTASGHGVIRWIAHPKERVPVKTITVPLPRFTKGVPVRIDIKYGGKLGVSIVVDGRSIYNLPGKNHPLIAEFGSEFNLFTLLSSPSRGERNVFLMKPSKQSERALFWLTDISVRGTRSASRIKRQPNLYAPAKTAVLFCGPGFINAKGIETLRESGWKLEMVYEKQPFRGVNSAKFKEKLTEEELRKHRWVVLYDISAGMLGWDICLRLKEYVRSGGNLLILGGAQTLGRGRYFDSPLAECLPVIGKDSPTSMKKNSDNPRYAYIHQVRKKKKAVIIDSGVPVYEMSYGKGKVGIITWAVIGNPDQPFWEEKDWLKKILSP